MDNLTHSLIGAALGQAGLKRKTGLAMPALILGANLPDIDAPCVVYGVESLSMRRGITHGPIALALLPPLLAAALWGLDRWQKRRGTRPAGREPVRFCWLLALCYLAALTHPLFDWFNNYGIRLLEPFSSQWFYGDTLFIIDVWIWAMLGAGIWLSLLRERACKSDWANPAISALVGVSAYVAMNMGISAQAVAAARRAVPQATMVVANAQPLAFWQREVLVRSDQFYGSYRSAPFFALKGGASPSAINFSDPRIVAWAKDNRAARAFLFWSRMPVAELHPDRIILRDQRFMGSPASDSFTATLRPPRQANAMVPGGGIEPPTP